MKRLTLGLCVVVAATLAAGVLYAPPGGRGPGFGRGPRLPERYSEKDLLYVDGVIKAVNPDPKVSTITVTAKTPQGEGTATFTVTFETQIYVGDEFRMLFSLAVGDKVSIGYVKSTKGANPIALLIRVPKKTDKGAEAKPAE